MWSFVANRLLRQPVEGIIRVAGLAGPVNQSSADPGSRGRWQEGTSIASTGHSSFRFALFCGLPNLLLPRAVVVVSGLSSSQAALYLLELDPIILAA